MIFSLLFLVALQGESEATARKKRVHENANIGKYKVKKKQKLKKKKTPSRLGQKDAAAKGAEALQAARENRDATRRGKGIVETILGTSVENTQKDEGEGAQQKPNRKAGRTYKGQVTLELDEGLPGDQDKEGQDSNPNETKGTKSKTTRRKRNRRPETLEKMAIKLVEGRVDKLKGKGPWRVTAPVLQAIGRSNHPIIGEGVYEVIAERRNLKAVSRLWAAFSPNTSRRFLVGFDSQGNPKLLPITDSSHGQPNAWLYRFARGLNERVPIFRIVRDLIGTKGVFDGAIIGGLSMTTLSTLSSFWSTPVGIAGIAYAAIRVRDAMRERLSERQKAFDDTILEIRNRKDPLSVDIDDAYEIYRQNVILTNAKPAAFLDFTKQLAATEI